MVRFIDRTEELALLERDWRTSENAFIVVFGRRRIGKTRLVEEFLKEKDGMKYTADDVNKKVQIDEFRRILAAYTKDDFIANQEIKDWSALFSYLAKSLDREKRFYIWIDEFSYIIKNDASITSVLQKFIDTFVRNSKTFLIVSGSLYGLMSEKVLSHSSPLYGRRSRDVLLRPIPSAYIKDFLAFDFADSLKTALTVGGIPEYLRVASKYASYEDFIANEFFKTEGYFYREPHFLLSQEFKEIRTYFSILNAIAYGNSRPVNIANFVGINGREIYPYLELLISYGFVMRETSILGDKKRGLYRINENFLDFWFNFVHKNREKLERGTYHGPDGSELNAHLGKRFEMFIRDNFGAFFDGFDSFGRWWHEGEEMDALAINEKNKELLFAECKWEENANALKLARDLSEKSKLVEWHAGERQETLALFAKSFSTKIAEFEGKKVRCFDLRDIERMLK